MLLIGMAEELVPSCTEKADRCVVVLVEGPGGPGWPLSPGAPGAPGNQEIKSVGKTGSVYNLHKM